MESNPYQPPSATLGRNSQVSTKNYAVAVILAGIFGIFGVQHFYLGRIAHGLVDLSLSIAGFTLLAFDSAWGLLFLGVDVVHTIVVFFMLLVGTYKDGDGLLVTYPGQKIKPSAEGTPQEF